MSEEPGIAYFSLGNYPEAAKYHQQRLKLAKNIGDGPGEMKAMGNLGNTYHHLGDTDDAIAILQQCLGCLGIVYLSLNEYEQAIDYYQQMEVTILYTRAKIYQQIGNLEQSQKNCDEVLIIATELNIPLVEDLKELKDNYD
jgi:tetratricopeptide (TPR) repeat protein